MFTEILRIKAVLDRATAKAMEMQLSARFSRVARRFGQGLRALVKGSLIGLSVGLLSRLLNPLEAIEEKIKNLLGQGTDMRDLADRFGTTPGEIERLQDVAESLDVKPDQLKDMLTKYAQAVEQGRLELQNPLVNPSEATQAVRNTLDERDMVKGFQKFLTLLKERGEAPGEEVALTPQGAVFRGQVSDAEFEARRQAGLTRVMSGVEARQQFEKAVFGESLVAGQRRLVETDVAKQAEVLKLPSTEKFNAAINRAATFADQQRVLQIQNENKDFLAASERLNEKMVKDMEMARAKEQERITAQLESYKSLKDAQRGINEINALLGSLQREVLFPGLKYLAELVEYFRKAKENKLFRLFGGGK